eukprot:5271317-Amphidinium_carterae.2
MSLCFEEEEWSLTPWQVGFYMGSLSFVAGFGALLTSGIADRFGRCTTFAVSQVAFIIGVAACLSNCRSPNPQNWDGNSINLKQTC